MAVRACLFASQIRSACGLSSFVRYALLSGYRPSSDTPDISFDERIRNNIIAGSDALLREYLRLSHESAKMMREDWYGLSDWNHSTSVRECDMEP